MKRPGDEPSSSIQPANKLQKSVTFSLPSPAAVSSVSLLNSSPATSGNNMTGNQPSHPPPQTQTQQMSSSSSSLHDNNHQQQQRNRSGILRSASSSAASVTPSPRFTFDFVDDASLGTSINTSATQRSSNGSRGGGGGGAYSYSSPTNNSSSTLNRRGSSSSNNKLSPSRLDARYSSRLPPSYHSSNSSPSHHYHHHNYYHRSHSANIGGDEIKRNLFGGGSLLEGNAGGGSNSNSVMAMDESSDFMMEDASMANNSNSNSNSSNPGTPSSAQRSSSSFHYFSNSPRNNSTPRHNAGHGLPCSPRSSLSVHTSATATSATTTRSVSTFLSNSPRKRGMVNGVTSPLSGNLSHASSVANAAAASSAASSPANSSVGGAAGGNTMMVDYESRAGDRFIPSRALSNFNFELAAGTGNVMHLSATSVGGGSGNGGSGNNNNNGGGGIVDDVDLNPAPSFGATMMGGGTIVDETPATAGGAASGTTGGADGGGAQPGIASTFSDDAASTDGADEHRHDATNRQPLLYDALLRSELLGENIDPAMHSQSPTGLINNSSNNANGGGGGGRNSNRNSNGNNGVVTPFRERSNNLRFSPNPQQFHHNSGGGMMSTMMNTRSSIVNSFQLSPVSMSPNQRTNLGSYTERCKRKIAKVPTKVLDAPALQDDFYLNLVDWSSQNVLAVGLGSCVYLWSAATSRVTQLCDLSTTEETVTSVAWSEGGRHLAIGSTGGDVQLWDASAQKLIRTMTGHSARVGALSWKLTGSGGGGGHIGGSSSLLASGSRDRLIHLRDPRSDNSYEMRLCGHKQEVCGLRWSFDERSMLASGGNDNKLLVWDVKKHTQPFHTFADHTAAVKAIAWSPHQHGLLASGGGTADRCIRFWNCLTGHGINCIDTGSQVCNLAFSKNCNELVSTHGYSLNQIVVWKYPSMQKIATLTGHTYRVLYLALSPDGSTIVTGAGDETLRFWQVFPGPQKENKAGGLLFPAGMPGSVIR